MADEEFIPYAVIRAFQDALKEYVDGKRADMFGDLVERYEADGAKSWDIPLPGEDKKVATISLSFSKAEPKVDDKAEFVKWAQWNAPDLVKERVVPETREFIAKSTAIKSLVDDYGAQPTEDGHLVTSDGVVVPGVHVSEERPQTFSLRWATDGKRRVEVAYGNGSLNNRLLDTPMPLIEGPKDEGAES